MLASKLKSVACANFMAQTVSITQGIILEVFEKEPLWDLGTSKVGFYDGVKLRRAWTEREGLSDEAHTVVRSQESH